MTSSVFYRDLHNEPKYAEFSGSEIIGSFNRQYADLSAGAGITCLGHDNDPIKEAMIDQINRLPYVHAMNWTSEATEALADLLLELTTQGDLDSKFHNGRVFFLNSGAESVEAACKLAIQCAYEQQRNPYLYSRRHSYHGNTMFTLALGDHPKKQLYPIVGREWEESIARFPAYRPSVSDNLALEWLARNMGTLVDKEKSIVVVEPIGGTTLGIEPSSTMYLETLSAICDSVKGILIYDEVLSGNYRTGELFAYQYYKAPEPDIICLGKGLTGGYFPLSAVIVSERLVDIITNGSGKLWHSSTNQNHPIGCAAGIAALREYDKIKDRLPEFGRKVREMAVEQLSKAGCEIAGVGSLLGVRLDPDEPGLHFRVRQQCLKHQVAVYTDGGTIDGKGNMILLAPPYSYLEDMNLLDVALCRMAHAIQNVMEKANA